MRYIIRLDYGPRGGVCTVYNQENAVIKFPPVKAEWEQERT